MDEYQFPLFLTSRQLISTNFLSCQDVDEYQFQLFLTSRQLISSNFLSRQDVDEYQFPLFLTPRQLISFNFLSRQDVDEYQFPLFLTSRQLILMLDASLPAPHFFERNNDGSMRNPTPDLQTSIPDLLNDLEEDTEDGQ